MPNLTYTIANSDLNLFSNSAFNAGIVQGFTPVKEYPDELTAVFSFPKKTVENLGEEGEYTYPTTFVSFSLLNEVVIKDLSKKPKTLWGLFAGLEVDEEEIEKAKKSLFASGF